MALFRKKPPADGGGEDNGSGSAPAFEPQPEKARAWFQHAQTSADASNYSYSLTCYANGIKLDPEAMSAHDDMFRVAVKYMNSGGKPASTKEIRSIDDGTPVGRFAAADFEWMKDLKNIKAALKMLEAAAKADQSAYAGHMAPQILKLLSGQNHKKKLSKNQLVQAMGLFRDVGAWDESMMVGELARELDPSDNDLAAELKNLSAQRAMDQGGYTKNIGKEGGFRDSIKDADKQRELIESESISGGTTEERNLNRARARYEEAPDVPDHANAYAQLLKKQATPEAEEQAYDIYMKCFEVTGEFRMRVAAGDIRIEQSARKVRDLDEKLAARPDDAQLIAAREDKNRALLELKTAEYEERVRRYPTDRIRKFQLGEVQYELGDLESAMAQFQAAKDEPRLRVRASHMLGRCFHAEGWHDEAISEMRDALSHTESTDSDRELIIKYDLMLALIDASRQERDIELAKEAKSICSEIARKDITYRDIRAKRKEVDEVIKELSGG